MAAEEKVSTFCIDCDNVLSESRKRHPRYWLCVRAPNITLLGFGYVTNRTWDSAEPYIPCHRINGGGCEMFKPIPEGEKE